MKLVALPDWEIRLVAWAGGVLGKPFSWGETNCVALAMRALDAQCGSDLGSRHRRQMATPARARAWVARNGISALVDGFLSVGCVRIEPAFMQVGDITLAELPDTIGAAVCLGRTMLSSTPEGGVALFHPDQLAAPFAVLGVR